MSAAPTRPTEPLLATKLYIPRIRTSQVARPQLIARLDETLERKVALLSAPGGFGKTALLSQWAKSLSLHMPMGWLSLTESDSDPAAFWSYIAEALDRVEPGFGHPLQAALQTITQGGLDSLWMACIHGVSSAPHDFVLVLDDYHLITNPAIHSAMGHLIDQMPPEMHLVLSGRTEPPLPLARLRAAGELVELRAEDLRFTPQEAEHFLNEVKGLGLLPQQLSALEDRTEGWVAGLQMAALSMQGRADLDAFIAAFTGSHRFIVDYLGEEVLARLPAEVRRFLVETAILDRLSGPLCDQVTATTGGQAMLHRLEQENLFIVQLDEQREWYRYHHLFADVLRARLRSEAPDQELLLHRRACAWYAAHGQVAAAVQHALAAGDLSAAADLMEQTVEAMTKRGEWQTIITWMEALPEPLVAGRPHLAIAYAGRLVDAGHLDAAESLLLAAEASLETGACRDGALRGRVAALRAFIRRIRRDLPAAVDLSRQALALLPEEEVRWRGTVTLRLAGAYQQLGDWEQADSAAAEAAALSRQAGDLHAEVIALCLQGSMQMDRGRGQEALGLHQQALRLCADRGPEVLTAASTAHGNMASLLRQRNDLEGAQHHAAETLRYANRAGHTEAQLHACLILAAVRQLQGDTPGAEAMLSQAEQIAPPEIDWVVRIVRSLRAQIALMRGDLAEALRWVDLYGAQITDEIRSPAPEISTLLWAQVAAGQPAPVLERVARLLPEAERSLVPLAQELHLFAALAHQQQGDERQALAALEAALALAESTGLILGFIVLGRPVAALLRKALPQSQYRGLIERLLTTTPAEGPGELAPQPLVEPLSQRELEVLRMVATGASNQEIAGRLFVALTTVKKHVGNIFGKLEATNRVQALARARELNLI